MARPTDLTLSPNISGTDQRQELNSIIQNGLAVTHIGSSAPSYASAGMLWIDNTSDPTWELYLHDGTDDILIGTIDTSGNLFDVTDALNINFSNIYGVSSGGTDSYAASVDSTINTYTAGQVFLLKIDIGNTGSATVDFNSIDPKNIILPNGNDLTTGNLVANQYLLLVYTGTEFQLLSSIANQNVIPGYINGCEVVYTDAATVTVQTGNVADSTNSAMINVASTIPVALSSSGAGGLDTGSEAPDTWYYIYLCSGSSGVTAVASVTNESVTGTIMAPTGYTTHKRQLPIAIKNNGSSNILETRIVAGWPVSPIIMYPEATNSSPYLLVSSSTASSGTISASDLAPPNATSIALSGWIYGVNNSNGRVGLKPSGASGKGRIVASTRYVTSGGITNYSGYDAGLVPCNSSQQVAWTWDGGNQGFNAVMYGYMFKI